MVSDKNARVETTLRDQLAGEPPDRLRCPICGYQMMGERRRPSRDRILPGAWGGTYRHDNLRIICQLCNAFRAAAGHCLGALACARAVARNARQNEVLMMQRWEFGRLAAETDRYMAPTIKLARAETGRFAVIADYYSEQNLAAIGTRVRRDLAREARREGVQQ